MTEIVIATPKLKKEPFIDQLGTWWDKVEPFFSAGGFDPIYAALKERSGMGKKIAPHHSLTFKAFRETPLEELKVVLLGMCPYHSIVNGLQVADGLSMSCGNHDNSVGGYYKAPSLINLYDALETEFEAGICLPCERPGSLQYLAEQGVLLTNAALTTEIGKPGIHLGIWRPFVKYLFEEIISTTGVPIVFLGVEAQYFSSFAAPMQWQFSISHPASAAYTHTKWDSQGVFTKVNKILWDTNDTSILWLMEALPF